MPRKFNKIEKRGASADLFVQLKKLENVEKVSNFYPGILEKGSLDFFFFLCPKMKGGRFRLNKNQTGFTTEYVEGLNNSTPQRIVCVKRFLEEFKNLKIPFTCRGILATADAIILFPFPVKPPIVFPEIEGVQIISNYELVKINFVKFLELINEKSWEKAPKRVRDLEFDRLFSDFPKYIKSPKNLIQDFVERTWAAYSLDGLLARAGKFGDNPILLGVESPGVAILQNAALPKEKWLPVVQLKIF